jgi:alkanesulfonate monooxygenase SsuD/methylene tetrahydromethanopterin reductase-like flavin-dependent oxidoreductase (luciferase family)
VRFVCNLGDCVAQPAAWGSAREGEGWDGLVVADHLWVHTMPGPHVWTLLGALAASTGEMSLGTGFANNLARHPIELAQAAMTMQRISGGRFEAGIGAGWLEEEMSATGRAMPSASERADRFIETVELVRELFDTGSCRFEGRFYQLDVDRLERLQDLAPPLLVAGVGGPRVTRAVAPYVDKLELMPVAVATRGGAIDRDRFNQVTRDDVRALIDRARSARDDLPLRTYVTCCAGDDERTRQVAANFDGFYADFQGSPQKVADAIWSLEELGVDEVHLYAGDEATFTNLAPLLDRPVTS